MSRGQKRAWGASGIVIGLLAAGAMAQEGGLQTTLSVSNSLRYDDNPDFSAAGSDSELTARTGLNFGLSSQTRSQRLTFGVGGTVIGELTDGDGIDLIDPNYNLNYALFNRTTELSFRTTFREADVNDVLPDEFDPENLEFSRGSRQDGLYVLGAVFGRGTPLTFSAELSQRDRDFTGVTNPSLFDTTTRRASVGVSLDVDPRITTSISASRNVYEAEDVAQTQRITETVRVGANFDVTQTISSSVSVSRTEIEETTTGGVTRSDGTGLGLGVTMARPNGNMSLRYSRNISTTGERDTLRFGREMPLPRGNLSYSVGVTNSDRTDPELIYNIDYVREFPRGTASIGLNRNARTSNESEDVIDTALRASYTHSINSISSLSVGFNFNDTDVQNVGGDARRVSVNATYRREVGRDWSLFGSATHTRADEDGLNERDRNVISFGLQKTFSSRP